MDTTQHGLRISDTGTWVMVYNNAEYDSEVAADTGEWYHLMVVRPDGAANGAMMYIDGDVAAAAPGGYDGANDFRLAIGGSTAEFQFGAGLTNSFAGVVDDLAMFVMGTSTDTQQNYGTFNLGTDNAFVAAEWGTIQDGDIDKDGNVTDTDVDIFVANWRAENIVTGITAGDGGTRALGDFNYDGVVDAFDWHILRANHPGGSGLNLGELLAAAGVPEPSSAVLLLLGVAGVGMIRRR